MYMLLKNLINNLPEDKKKIIVKGISTNSREVKNGYIYASTNELIGAQINFDMISVTATENIIMAATLAKGTSTINNAAQEPEVTDLIKCLNKILDAKISHGW